MKALITLCLLCLSLGSLIADDATNPGHTAKAASPVAQAVAASPWIEVGPDGSPIVQTAGQVTQPAPPDAFTAPPIVVGPDGSPSTSYYQGPGMPGPAAAPYVNPAPSPYGMPMVPPGGLVSPGMTQSIFPYKALTPDVTMAPTTPNGPLPDRFGWTQRYELGFLPFSDAKDNWGHFGEMEFDLGWKYITPLYPTAAIFSFTQQYDLRLWGGPSSPPSVPPTDLPGAVHRIGWDFELKSTTPGPLNGVLAFNPSINSDFQESLTKRAWNWDARAALLYSPTREITYVLGVLFWDRLNEQVLPWAGVIYRPNEYWQFDLVFPQFRVSAYLWDEFGFRTSIYGRVEYHTEAYEIFNPVLDERDRVALSDWRALIGVNKDQGNMDYFIEGGWVFGRNVNYLVAPQGFDVTSGAIIRAGLRF